MEHLFLERGLVTGPVELVLFFFSKIMPHGKDKHTELPHSFLRTGPFPGPQMLLALQQQSHGSESHSFDTTGQHISGKKKQSK